MWWLCTGRCCWCTPAGRQLPHKSSSAHKHHSWRAVASRQGHVMPCTCPAELSIHGSSHLNPCSHLCSCRRSVCCTSGRAAPAVAQHPLTPGPCKQGLRSRELTSRAAEDVLLQVGDGLQDRHHLLSFTAIDVVDHCTQGRAAEEQLQAWLEGVLQRVGPGAASTPGHSTSMSPA